MHKAMDPFTPSHCPLCRSEYAHFPQVCEQLHFFLQEAFPAEYNQREQDTTDEEVSNGVYSLELQSLHRHTQVGGKDVSASTWTPDYFECTQCSKLLYNPVVLNCGHAVCQATCRPWADGSPDSACPRCKATVVGDPAVCTQWQEQLVKLLPEQMCTRAIQCAAADSCKHLAEASGRAAASAVVKPEVAQRQPQAAPPAGGTSGQTGPTATATLRQRLLHNIRQDFIHHGVGCDACGLYPIRGHRYKCQDCPDKVGFDLCNKCHGRGLHITGRFNQQHTPEHKMGLVRPQPTVLHIFQAANPELSMSQIQQLTALAFARDDPEQAVQPPAPAPASPSDASHNDGPSASEVQAEPATGPSPPVSGQAGPSGTVASETPAGGAGPPGSGSSAAAAAADFAHARSDGSEWASGFIAEARAQNEASSDALTSLSGALRRSRARAQTLLSPGRWFGSQSEPAPLPNPAPSGAQPTPLPAFLAQSNQQAASSHPAARPSPPRAPLSAPRPELGPDQQRRRPAARPPSHNTEWRWNLGGPSNGAQSGQSQRQNSSPPSASAPSRQNAGGSDSTGWQWNLGGAWQAPTSQGRGRPSPGPGIQGDRPSWPLSRDSLSSRDGGGSQRPWQRRRVQAEPTEGQPAREGVSEVSRAEGSFSQGWRRLVPRFMRRTEAAQDVPVVPAASQHVAPVQQEAAPAADQLNASVLPSQPLVLPDVPNVWDEMEMTTEGSISVPEEVQYMEGGEANNLASDAMLLIMHAMQARSQGRSLTQERRASAEQYWRQAEEQGEARLFRSSSDTSRSNDLHFD
ncbi:hypothetical protein ABBQ32_001830 [Trebouxia sp. C0010 RCD-2024]